MKRNISVIKEILFLYYSYKRVKKHGLFLMISWSILSCKNCIKLRLEVHKPIVITKFFCLPLRSCLRRRGLCAQPPARVQGRSSSRVLGGGVAPGFFFVA